MQSKGNRRKVFLSPYLAFYGNAGYQLHAWDNRHVPAISDTFYRTFFYLSFLVSFGFYYLSNSSDIFMNLLIVLLMSFSDILSLRKCLIIGAKSSKCDKPY